MRLKLFFIAFFLFIFITVNSQESKINRMLEENIVVKVSSASLHQCFKLIESYGIILSYNPSLLDMNQEIRIKEGKKSVDNFLREILSKYEYKIIPSETSKLIIQINGRKPLMVSGVIKEDKSGEKLYAAAIRFKDMYGKEFVTVSDDNGFFNLSLPYGIYKIDINYMGYEPFHGSVLITQNSNFVYKLFPLPFSLKEVVVKPRTGTNELNELSPSNLLTFSRLDVFSKIKILPGVIGSPTNGNMQVNGGSGDENLILLDGVPIYQTNHLSSMLSLFNGDAIKNVAFHESFFPAHFEGRLSSVMDIKLKDGNKEMATQTLSLDMPSASAMLEGPIIKNKLSYMIAGRRSWMDFFDNLLSEEERLNHSFSDVNAKLSYYINNNTSLQLGAYKASDNYYFPMDDNNRQWILNWKSEAYYLKLKTLLGKVMNTNTLAYAAYSNQAYAPMVGVNSQNYITGGVKDFSFTSNFSLNLDNIYTFSGGIKASHEKFNMASLIDTISDSVSDTVEMKKVSITQLSLFYNTRVSITDNIYAQAGVNFVAYLPTYQDKLYSLQPRFSVKYSPTANHLLYANFSRMEQFYHYIRIDALPLPTDFRMPSVDGIKPSTSEHYEVGWKFFMRHSVFESSIYYKRRHNIIAIRQEAYLNNGDWDKSLMDGEGESYGLKLHYFANWEKFALLFSYTFSRSKEWFGSMKERGKMPSKWDVPHIGHFALSYHLNEKSAFSLGGIIHSGRILDGNSNMEILPDNEYRRFREKTSYRIDASYSYMKQFNKETSKLLFRVGLYNILGNPNYEDALDFYSINFNRHCLPYGSITFKF